MLHKEMKISPSQV
jgi:hypothetical protein